MALFESIFDISYLILVIGLGIRMLLLEDRGARLLAAGLVMAMLELIREFRLTEELEMD